MGAGAGVPSGVSAPAPGAAERPGIRRFAVLPALDRPGAARAERGEVVQADVRPAYRSALDDLEGPRIPAPGRKPRLRHEPEWRGGHDPERGRDGRAEPGDAGER